MSLEKNLCLLTMRVTFVDNKSANLLKSVTFDKKHLILFRRQEQVQLIEWNWNMLKVGY